MNILDLYLNVFLNVTLYKKLNLFQKNGIFSKNIFDPALGAFGLISSLEFCFKYLDKTMLTGTTIEKYDIKTLINGNLILKYGIGFFSVNDAEYVLNTILVNIFCPIAIPMITPMVVATKP